MNLFDSADDTHVEVFLQQTDAFDQVTLVSHVGCNTLVFSCLMQLVGFPDPVDQGFLHADMFPAADGFHGCREVGVVRGGDGDSIEFVAHGGEHLAEVLEELRVGVERFGLFEALAVHVAEGDDLRSGGGICDIAGSFSADTDSPELQLFRGLGAHVREEQSA